jgi:hypothetical protein
MSLGGQRRTIEVPCGFVIRGHPTEANSKLKRHSRLCKKCIEIRGDDKPPTLPEFSAAAGAVNGWGGINKGGLVNNMVSQVAVNGAIKSVSVATHSIMTSIDRNLLALTLLEQEDNEKRGLISEIVMLQLSAPCSVYECNGDLYDLPFSKLKVIHSIILKQIADFENKK